MFIVHHHHNNCPSLSFDMVHFFISLSSIFENIRIFFFCKHLIHPSIHVNTVLYENYYSTFRKTTQRKLSFYIFLTFVNFQFFFSVHKTTWFDSCISSQHYMDTSFILVIFIISVFVCCPLPMFFFLLVTSSS